MKRPRMPMFQGGNRVQVWINNHVQGGRVDMASAKLRSLFISLDGGLTLKVLGMPRTVKKRRAKRL